MSKKEYFVIWDLDGTLLDTEGVSTKVIETVTKDYLPDDYIIDPELNKLFYGLPTLKWVDILLEHKHIGHLTTNVEFAQKYEDLMMIKSLDTPYMPGAMELVQFFHKHHIHQAVATSSIRPLLEGKRDHHQELFQYFDVLVSTSDGIEHGKPFPDIFLKAAELLHADPSQCIVFEDSVNGMKAGLAAGMHVVGVPPANVDTSFLTGMSQTLRSLFDFDSTPFGLPPFQQ